MYEKILNNFLHGPFRPQIRCFQILKFNTPCPTDPLITASVGKKSFLAGIMYTGAPRSLTWLPRWLFILPARILGRISCLTGSVGQGVKKIFFQKFFSQFVEKKVFQKLKFSKGNDRFYLCHFWFRTTCFHGRKVAFPVGVQVVPGSSLVRVSQFSIQSQNIFEVFSIQLYKISPQTLAAIAQSDSASDSWSYKAIGSISSS